MTKTVSVRVRPATLAKIDARAAQLGFDDRSKYLLSVVRTDIEGMEKGAHKFRSSDLVGSVKTKVGPATNRNTRRIMASALKGKREKHR